MGSRGLRQQATILTSKRLRWRDESHRHGRAAADRVAGRIRPVTATADIEHRHKSVSIGVHGVDEYLQEAYKGQVRYRVAGDSWSGDLVVDGYRDDRVATSYRSTRKSCAQRITASCQNLKWIARGGAKRGLTEIILTT